MRGKRQGRKGKRRDTRGKGQKARSKIHAPPKIGAVSALSRTAVIYEWYDSER